MMLRRRLIPVAALVVAIGASAAGAATAEAGTTATKTGQKPVKCEVVLKKGVKPPVSKCEKKVDVASLDKIASELGVSKTVLAEALKETKLWIIGAKPKPSVTQFEQHLADQLHVPVAKVVSVFGSGAHLTVNGAV
jgi:hypothetical protein